MNQKVNLIIRKVLKVFGLTFAVYIDSNYVSYYLTIFLKSSVIVIFS
jgi:hypothetical protein